MNKKLLFSIILVMLLLTPTTVMADTEEEPFVTDLMAGQHIDVGDVSVWNNGENLYVKYETIDNWYLTETHLQVATSSGVIPQKNGNPIPGHFDNSMEHNPPVQEYTYVINLEDFGQDKLYIAAHADVMRETMRETISAVTDLGFSGFDDTTVFSTSDAMSNLGTSTLSLISSFGQLTGYYGVETANLTHRGTRGLGVVEGEVDEVDREDNSNPESIVITFGSAVYVDWLEIRSLFTKDQPPDEHGQILFYKGVTLEHTEDLVGQQSLSSGNGQVHVDYTSPPEADKLVFLVPEPYGVGHEFAVAALEVFQIQEETAWGDGKDFPGKNWATYFTYEIQPVL